MADARTEFVIEPGRQGIVMTCEFDAPRDIVFKAMTDPALIPKWWGPRSLTTTVEQMDVRPGGLWRFIQRDSEANEYGFWGVFHDIVPPERLAMTFEFEGVPGHVALDTHQLEDAGGRTKLVATSLFQSVEDRDGMVRAGMESGAREGNDRLAELVESMLAKR